MPLPPYVHIPHACMLPAPVHHPPLFGIYNIPYCTPLPCHFAAVALDEKPLPPVTITCYDFEGHEDGYNLQDHVLYTDAVCVLTVDLSHLLVNLEDTRRGVVWWLDSMSKTADKGTPLSVVLLGTFMDKVGGVRVWECACACMCGYASFLYVGMDVCFFFPLFALSLHSRHSQPPPPPHTYTNILRKSKSCLCPTCQPVLVGCPRVNVALNS